MKKYFFFFLIALYFCNTLHLKLLFAGEIANEMIYIEAGEFAMGRIMKKFYLDSYYIDQFETTNIEYAKFLKKTGHRKPLYFENANFNRPMQPVVGVNWFDAKEFCEWQKKYLPSEAQWEKAASWEKNKGQKYDFPWGNTFDPGKINYDKSGIDKPTPVGSYEAGKSPYGVYGMAGNVWEWTADWFEKGYLKSAPYRNPKGPTNGGKRVVRGGSFGDEQVYAYTVKRSFMQPEYRFSTIGVRCAKSIK